MTFCEQITSFVGLKEGTRVAQMVLHLAADHEESEPHIDMKTIWLISSQKIHVIYLTCH